ncbi:uncharacterized protein L201_007641 [Kwoniella dendrophila CBS 6074]|uniref:C2H2-type domain-containing protein n=1 Tax=Kwoniella dendrophila CBS 6074 TaxID=1295534 RepID=A0AAX4K736_9TREE
MSSSTTSYRSFYYPFETSPYSQQQIILKEAVCHDSPISHHNAYSSEQYPPLQLLVKSNYQQAHQGQYPYPSIMDFDHDNRQVSPLEPAYSSPVSTTYPIPSDNTCAWSQSPSGTTISSSSYPPNTTNLTCTEEVANNNQTPIDPRSSQALPDVRAIQTMSRAHTWPITSIEGRLQGLNLRNGEMCWNQTEQPLAFGHRSYTVAGTAAGHTYHSYTPNHASYNNPPSTYTAQSSASAMFLCGDSGFRASTTPTSEVYNLPPYSAATSNDFQCKQPTWQSTSSPTDHSCRPRTFSRQQAGNHNTRSPHLFTLAQYDSSTNFAPVSTTPYIPIPTSPTFVVRPSLEMMTCKVSKPKRRLPTPPRVNGWIPPEQRPLPCNDYSRVEGKPRLLPIPEPTAFTLPPADPPKVSTSKESATCLRTPKSTEYSGVSNYTLQCETLLPQLQPQNRKFGLSDKQAQRRDGIRSDEQNTFAFGMLNLPEQANISITAQLFPSSDQSTVEEHSCTEPISSSDIYMPFSSPTYTDNPLPQPTLSFSPSSSIPADLLTRVPFRPSFSLARPGSEPNRRRGKSRTCKRPSTGSSSTSRRTRMENKLATSAGKLRFLCPECSEPFTRRNDLERHARSKHTGETPYQCPGCEKAFSRKDKLDQHIEKSQPCKAIAPPREQRVRRRTTQVQQPLHQYDPDLHSPNAMIR